MQEGARIDHLRVKAHGRRGIPMVQSAIEDAFRTELSAAGPAVRRGLLVIRHIDFGPIGSRRDQVAIKRRLAAILREAARNAVIPTADEEVAQEAVLFPDPLAPYLAVFQALAQGKPVPRSWPYRAVLGEKVFARPERIVEEVIIQQLGMAQAGPALRTLLPALGRHLPSHLQRIPAALRAAILMALTGGGLEAESADLPLAPDQLVQLALDLAEAMQQPASAPSFDLSAGSELPEREILTIIVALALSASGRAARPARVALVVDAVRTYQDAVAASETMKPDLQLLVRRLRDVAKVQCLPDEQGGVRGINVTLETLIADLLADAPSIAGSAQDPSGRNANKAPDRREDSPAPATQETVSHPESDSSPVTGFEPTRHAGIGYAIALVERTFGSWLGRPDHLALATGQILLRRMLERLSPHVEDPALCFFDALGKAPESTDAPCAFQLLPEMLPDTLHAIRIHPIAGHPGWRVAKLGRLTIAAWHGRAGPATRSLLAGTRRIERGSPSAFSQEAMLASCEWGLRRILRTGPHLRMAQLLRRHGELAHSPTHLDIALDAGVIDLTIRRWALDVSPGWCAWLWRVVTVHYDFGEQDVE